MKNIKINSARLNNSLDELGEIGALEGGGNCRLAFTKEDKLGRDLLVKWMKETGLEISIDEIGNIIGTRKAKDNSLAPVMMGSHIDTVRTGGKYDGCLGVLSGLEVIRTLNENDITTNRPVCLGIFSNEEGGYIPPDMMGSMARQNLLDVNEMLNIKDEFGVTVEERLKEIGYKGEEPCKPLDLYGYFELHIEQGPILDMENIDIGVVEGVKGISWTEISIEGVSNHAGTTPIEMRKDAGLLSSKINVFARELTHKIGNNMFATVGLVDFYPKLINVIPNKVIMTVDFRHPEEKDLVKAEKMLEDYVKSEAKKDGLKVSIKRVARYSPIAFNEQRIASVEKAAKDAGLSTKRLYSGAGHDAQSFAPTVPTAMIFVPNKDGISHNIEEYAKPEDVENGANVLLNLILDNCM